MSSLSDRQVAALRSVADALCPSLAAPPGSAAAVARFWTTSAGDLDALVAGLRDAIDRLDADERFEIRLLLAALSTAIGSALLVPGGGPCGVPFCDRNAEERERGLRCLATSRLAPRRKAFLALKRLVLGLALSYAEPEGKEEEEEAARGGEGGARRNPYWPGIGYPGPPPRSASPDPDEGAGPIGVEDAFLRISSDTTLEVDAVVVGSGAGGGAMAARLAKAGYEVLVLEKGRFFAPSRMSQIESEAIRDMYEKSGLLTTDDGAVSILAGATFGGGTAINWACCLDTPGYVRREWADAHGLSQFAGEEFDAALAAVAERIGASAEGVEHNRSNQILLRGCEALGYDVRVTPQNFRDTSAASAGWSCFGDRHSNKQGSACTFLADAAAAGASFVAECSVDRVTHARGVDGRRRATGVVGRVGAAGHALRVSARRGVVVACGSLHSPCLLLRSGLEHPHVGRHLALHPVTAACGRFAAPCPLWNGAPMTTVCGEAAMGPAGDGYGAKIEVPSVHPGLMAANGPWESGRRFKEVMEACARTAVFIVLQRDHGEGTVRLGPDGFSPKVRYRLDPRDAEAMDKGLKVALRIMAANGCEELWTVHNSPARLPLNGERCGDVSSTAADSKLEAFLKDLDSIPVRADNSCGIFSAHQMGSNRMGVDATTSVVDCDGEVWECDGLFVADASVFPTSSGSNPMMTTLAIAHMLGGRLAERWQAEDGKSAESDDAAAMRRERREAGRAALASARRRRIVAKVAFASAAVAAIAAVVAIAITIKRPKTA
ncbi:hypothetical protein ACHAWF_014357 [Thalassiosira exigua]